MAAPIRPAAIVTADAPWMMSADRVIALAVP
jgi:hypothetical protein